MLPRFFGGVFHVPDFESEGADSASTGSCRVVNPALSFAVVEAGLPGDPDSSGDSAALPAEPFPVELCAFFVFLLFVHSLFHHRQLLRADLALKGECGVEGQQEAAGFPHDPDRRVAGDIHVCVADRFVPRGTSSFVQVFEAGDLVVHPYHQALPSESADVFGPVVGLFRNQCFQQLGRPDPESFAFSDF
jgi:hypothetical protein